MRDQDMQLVVPSLQCMQLGEYATDPVTSISDFKNIKNIKNMKQIPYNNQRFQ